MTDVHPPPGWYPDPGMPGGERYWDGAAWSEATRPAPLPPPAPTPPPPSPQPFAGQPYGTQPYGGQPYGGQPAPPAKGGGTWWKVLLVLFALMVLAVGGCVALLATAADDITRAVEEIERIDTESETIVEETAVITDCSLGETGTATAVVEFTNPFDDEKGYIMVEVSFYEDDIVVGSGSISFTNLSPGETGRGDAVGVVAEGTTAVTCRVTDGLVL